MGQSTELKPDFIEKMKIIEKEETLSVGNIEDFTKRYKDYDHHDNIYKK